MYPCDAPLCGPLMEASPTCCYTSCAAMHGSDGSTIAAPLAALHLVEGDASKCVATIVPKPPCCRVAPGRLRALQQTYGARLHRAPYGAHGPVQARQDGVSQQGAKPALARFVPLLTRLLPHGGTLVPSTLVTWSRLNPASTGKTDGRGTTSRRRYRLNDPWYHRGWSRLFSPS